MRCQKIKERSLLILLILLLSSCEYTREKITPSAAFAPYISAYSGEVLSVNSTIRIELTTPIQGAVAMQEVKKELLTLHPAVEGEAHWLNDRTIEFVPQEGELKSGGRYRVDFNLGAVADVDRKLSKFSFTFDVMAFDYSLQLDPISIASSKPNEVTVKGRLFFSDFVRSSQVREHIKLSTNNEEAELPSISFSESAEMRQVEEFTLEGIKRLDTPYVITLSYQAAGSKKRCIEEVMVPALKDFSILEFERIDKPENGVRLIFSQPLLANQNLRGLVDCKPIPSRSLAFEQKENQLFLYFEESSNDTLQVVVDKGVKDFTEKPLSKEVQLSLAKEIVKPAVSIEKEGAILPNSEQLILPFRAVGLSAVTLNVVQIYPSNIPLFLQQNELEESSNLHRVGRLIHKQKFPLHPTLTNRLDVWNNYSIDLSTLFKQDPNAIYRIILSFDQEDAVLSSNSKAIEKSRLGEMVSLDQVETDKEEQWDNPERYYYSDLFSEIDWTLYKWSERDNPYHPSYYMGTERFATCNVLASDIGVIVKKGDNNKLWVAVTDMLTTDPLQRATVSVLNYQLQEIGNGITDSDGFVTLAPKGKPFLVVTTWKEQKNYVKVIDGKELSMSRFDVGGKEVENGLKGFLYTERGVWRPGDTIYLTFMLEDQEKKIPANHPVSLEVYSPRGQFYWKDISKNSMEGVYSFEIPIQSTAPTGVWNAYVKVGGTHFHKALRVETIKPNRLKIDLGLAKDFFKKGENSFQPKLSSSWLTGAVAANLEAQIELVLSRADTKFRGYEEYTFNNPLSTFSTSRSEVFKGKLDPNGVAYPQLKFPEVLDAPGYLNGRFITRVFEPGGDVSISSDEVNYSPFKSYVGVALTNAKGGDISFTTGEENKIAVVSLDENGKEVERSLAYKIYKLEWSWWWEHAQKSYDSYINKIAAHPVLSGTLKTVGGKGNLPFKIADKDWGRYLVFIEDKESGHASGGEFFVDWPSWYGRDKGTTPTGITMLDFSLDKEEYAVGEEATVILPKASKGRALLSIENGSKVIAQRWVRTSDKHEQQYSFKVTEEFLPNAYVHISLLQPHGQTVNGLPMRLYGVRPIKVVDKQTELSPVIHMPKELAPEKEFTLQISEKEGREMVYTVAIVDEGLLDLTNYRTPNPWQEFSLKEALGVGTWDIYDQVLGAVKGRVGQLFGIGGDEMLKPGEAVVNRFKPVVRFIGPFKLDSRRTNTHQLKLPAYIGSVRTMVVAKSGRAYGNAEVTTQVKSPLMLLSTLPRVVSIGEEIEVPVNVFTREEKVKNVRVTLKPSSNLKLIDEGVKNIAFSKIGDQLVRFRLKVGCTPGEAEVTILAEGGGVKAKETIKLAVRNPNPPIVQTLGYLIQPNEKKEIDLLLDEGEVKTTVRATVSRIPSIDLERRLSYLHHYPHQCTEQLVSKALPLLFLPSLTGIDGAHYLPYKKEIQEVIHQLYSRQNSDGSFRYWSNSSRSYPWLDSYLTVFLSLAKEKGFAVNQLVFSRLQEVQRKRAREWRSTTALDAASQDYDQAYRLYSLALASAPELGAMNRLKVEEKLDSRATWMLASAYALSGKSSVGNQLVASLPTRLEKSVVNTSSFGSYKRDKALLLEAMTTLNRLPEAFRLAQEIAQELAEEEYFDTQYSAVALTAMARMSEAVGGTLEVEWSVNQNKSERIISAQALQELKIPEKLADKNQLTLENKGTAVVYLDLTKKWQPLVDNLPASSNGLQLTVLYTDMAGKKIDVAKIRQGVDFIAYVKVKNRSQENLSNLSLTHIIPAGWEIYSTLLPTERGEGNQVATYEEVRDDRILSYFNLNRGEEFVQKVRLQAAYVGRFTQPAVSCEVMYDPTYRARTKANDVEVIR